LPSYRTDKLVSMCFFIEVGDSHSIDSFRHLLFVGYIRKLLWDFFRPFCGGTYQICLFGLKEASRRGFRKHFSPFLFFFGDCYGCFFSPYRFCPKEGCPENPGCRFFKDVKEYFFPHFFLGQENGLWSFFVGQIFSVWYNLG